MSQQIVPSAPPRPPPSHSDRIQGVIQMLSANRITYQYREDSWHHIFTVGDLKQLWHAQSQVGALGWSRNTLDPRARHAPTTNFIVDGLAIEFTISEMGSICNTFLNANLPLKVEVNKVTILDQSAEQPSRNPNRFSNLASALHIRRAPPPREEIVIHVFVQAHASEDVLVTTKLLEAGWNWQGTAPIPGYSHDGFPHIYTIGSLRGLVGYFTVIWVEQIHPPPPNPARSPPVQHRGPPPSQSYRHPPSQTPGRPSPQATASAPPPPGPRAPPSQASAFNPMQHNFAPQTNYTPPPPARQYGGFVPAPSQSQPPAYATNYAPQTSSGHGQPPPPTQGQPLPNNNGGQLPLPPPSNPPPFPPSSQWR